MLNKITVLYVEYNDEVYNFVTSILKTITKHITRASNDKEALKLYKQYKPDIVITDIQILQTDNLKMARKIKAINEEQSIIIISAFNNPQIMQEAISIGINGYIFKPIEQESLIKEFKKRATNVLLRKIAQRNKYLYEKYYNTTNDSYISVDIKTHKIVNCNKTAQEKFGYSKKEFEKLTIDALYVDKQNANSVIEKTLGTTKNKESFQLHKIAFVTKDDRRFYGDIKIYPIEDEDEYIIQTHSVIKDISSDLLLEYEEKYLETVFETTNDFIITTFGNKIDRANSATFEFVGYKDIEEFKKEHDCICDFFLNEKGFLQKDMNGQNWVEYVINNPKIYHKAKILKDEKEYIFGVVARRFVLDEFERYIVFLTDITNLEIQYNTIKEQEELLMFQSKQAAMGELIGMIAHQWKQPLSILSVIASSQLLNIDFSQNISNEQIGKDANEIMKQVNYLSDTIDNFRDFLKPNKTTNIVKISDVLNDFSSIIKKSLENNNISLNIDIENDIELKTYASELAQCFINICNNSKDAFIEKNIDDRVITIRAKEESQNLIVTIQDNAGGITEEILPKIFNPYFTTKSEDKGTGIGLYMVKNIITKHLHGEIRVTNISNGIETTIKIPTRLNNNEL